MNRRFFKSLTLWIVPLLVLRAMVPAGYMLMAGEGGLQMMFCPSVVQPTEQVTAHAGHEHHAGMQHGDAGGHSRGFQHDNAPCPFSLTATAALTDVPYLATVSNLVAGPVVDFLSAPAVSAGPLRADRIRGPPQLS
ncbi:MAG TPA: hypothetical protein VKB34_00160 [Povalibacter sp.]|nr:hypothetical protein [Povalibacter sp.]